MTLGISPFPDRNAYCASELDKLFEFASFYLAISIIEKDNSAKSAEIIVRLGA
jgi:hypothetical protein